MGIEERPQKVTERLEDVARTRQHLVGNFRGHKFNFNWHNRQSGEVKRIYTVRSTKTVDNSVGSLTVHVKLQAETFCCPWLK